MIRSTLKLNWLLNQPIRDASESRDTGRFACSAKDRSVASARRMEQIARPEPAGRPQHALQCSRARTLARRTPVWTGKAPLTATAIYAPTVPKTLDVQTKGRRRDKPKAA